MKTRPRSVPLNFQQISCEAIEVVAVARDIIFAWTLDIESLRS